MTLSPLEELDSRSRIPKPHLHPKVQAGGAAGALSILVVFVAAQLGLDVPSEVAAAFGTLVTFGAGYLRAG